MNSDPALRVYGNLSLLEMAPVLLAADRIHPGKTVIEHGSVMALWGRSSDIASLDSAGEAHVALNSETQALRGSVGNPDLRFIFTVAECPYRIVARRSAGIARLADLRGMRVATQLGSSAEFFLDVMLRTVGLTAEDVVLEHFMAHTEKPISQVPEALKSGAIDAVALWEPQPQRAKVAIGTDAIEFHDPAVYTGSSICAQGHLDARTRPDRRVRAVIDPGCAATESGPGGGLPAGREGGAAQYRDRPRLVAPLRLPWNARRRSARAIPAAGTVDCEGPAPRAAEPGRAREVDRRQRAARSEVL
jgi:hypothetical protein